MGFGRWLWRSTNIGGAIDTFRNIADEGSIIKGVKRTWKEDLCEDNPITSRIYQEGKFDGKKEGYVEASYDYETKFIRQADEFLKQKQIMENARDEYEKLLDEFEAEIEFLSNKVDKTKSENDYLQQLLLKERELRDLDSLNNH